MRTALAGLALMLLLMMALLMLASVEGLGQTGCGASGPVGGIPTTLTAVFEGAANEFDLGGQGASILAAVNAVESDFDRSHLAGVRSGANPAGAEGPMQLEPGTWRRYQVQAPGGVVPPDVYDEADAVYAAANYLHASGAPGNWSAAIFAYNHASSYVDEILTDAQRYYALGSGAVEVASCAATSAPIIPGARASILTDGEAEAPADAPAAVQEMIAAGNRIDDFPYSYGGGHGDPAETMNQVSPDVSAVPGSQENGGPGYDCSSATSYLLWGAGLGPTLLAGQVEDSTGLESVGEPGPGRWVTIYANPRHAYIEVAGIYFDTSAGLGRPPNPPNTGPRWSPVGSGPEGFVARHPPGL